MSPEASCRSLVRVPSHRFLQSRALSPQKCGANLAWSCSHLQHRGFVVQRIPDQVHRRCRLGTGMKRFVHKALLPEDPGGRYSVIAERGLGAV